MRSFIRTTKSFNFHAGATSATCISLFGVFYWNQQAEFITGVSKEEALGKIIWDCFPPSFRAAYYPSYLHVMQQGKPVLLEMYSERLGLWLEFSAYPAGPQLSVFFRDITERKKQNRSCTNSPLLPKKPKTRY